MDDFSKLDEIVAKEYRNLWSSYRPLTMGDQLASKLEKIGAKRFRFDFQPITNTEHIVKLHQTHPDGILCYLGHDSKKGHDVFVIPREMAEKIIVLGSIP